ncbi:MAG: hypothetical protein LBH59_09615 [Planctomycetaceae bacterium]|nr:hypothetical protein [Planctomycetaceae bacterium]
MVTYSHEVDGNRFTPIGKNGFENGIFKLPTDKTYREDIVLFSNNPTNVVEIQLPELTSNIKYWMKTILKDTFIPNENFIDKNTFFYSIPPMREKVTDKHYRPWQNGYDIAYIAYQVDDLSFLLAFTGTHAYGSTYLYIKKNGEDKQNSIDKILLSKIIAKDTFDLLKTENQEVSITPFPLPSVPVYFFPQSICLVRPHIFGNAIPSTDYKMNNFFSHVKKSLNVRREWEKKEAMRQKMIVDRIKKCNELVRTENGRVELIEMLLVNEGKIEFEGDDYRFDKFSKLPLVALTTYYKASVKNENKIHKDISHVSPIEIIAQSEQNSLRKLLKSPDNDVKKMGLKLVDAAFCTNLLTDVTDMAKNKEQMEATHTVILLDAQGNMEDHYKFEVYRLLGQMGNSRTLGELKKLQQTNTSEEIRNDILLAIENIQSRIRYNEHQRQNWLEQRRKIRKNKAIESPDSSVLIDIDKPDPEPVSKDGFRNWETVDGLFKTTAKFVGLVDVKNKVGKITDKDVQLLRNDNKTVAIEFSALRQIDREYIRQLLEPEREWITIDSNIKIKAKLLGNFDKEIILQESDGINTTIKTEALSDPDKEYLKQIPVSPHSKYAL